MYQLSPKGLALTKQFEGLRLTAYQDCVGVWTIGYGHTGSDVHSGLIITEQEAENLLLADMNRAITVVNEAVIVAVTQGQFDALCDFTFNVGTSALRTSTLLRILNAGDYTGAAEQFGRWVHAGGAVVAGLVQRRKAEAAMFTGSQA